MNICTLEGAEKQKLLEKYYEKSFQLPLPATVACPQKHVQGARIAVATKTMTIGCFHFTPARELIHFCIFLPPQNRTTFRSESK